ncbi:MAG: acyl carrier protein [Betaproteobacteria bacterium]
MTTTDEILRRIICDKFQIDPAQITPEATLEDLGIDSLDVFDVVFEAEDELGIKVANDEVKVGKFQDLVDLLDRIRQPQAST